MLLAAILTLAMAQDSGAPPTTPPPTRPTRDDRPFPPDRPILEIGRVVEEEITDHDEIVETPTLKEKSRDLPVRGRTYALTLPEPGTFRIELTSYFFDAYLVLRNADRTVLAEDDDGLLRSHSRLIVTVSNGGASYLVDACAMHGRLGPFMLTVQTGRPRDLTVLERTGAEIDDAREGLRVVEAARGSDHLDTARQLSILARLLREQNAFAEAQPLYERALRIRERSLGPDHRDTAAALCNLGAVLSQQGLYREARPLYERALKIYEATLGPRHAYTAAVMNNLAALLEEQGSYDEARTLYERAIDAQDGASDPQHADKIVPDLNNLASLLVTLGDSEGARRRYERALSICESVRGRDSSNSIASLIGLGALERDEGNFAQARRLLERALNICETTRGPNHGDTAHAASELAELLRREGDVAEAQPLCARALDIYERVLGGSHPNTATAINNLAALYMEQGNEGKASELFERALKLREAARGPEHPDVAQSLSNLAVVLESRGLFGDAEELQRRAYGIRQKALGDDHPATAKSLNNLAVLRYRAGDLVGSRRFHEAALASRQRALGAEHPDTIQSLINLALVRSDLGDGKEAIDLARRAFASVLAGSSRFLATATDWERLSWIVQGTGDVEVLLSVLANGPASDAASSSYEAIRCWKGIATRSFVVGRDRLAKNCDDDTRKKLGEIRLVQSQLSNELHHVESAHPEADDGRLAHLRRRYGELERELSSSGDVAPVDVSLSFDALRHAVPKGSAFVDFFVHRLHVPFRIEDGTIKVIGHWSDPRVSAWIVRPEYERPVWIDLGPADELKRAVEDYRDALAADSVASTGGDAARDLRRRTSADLRRALWNPLAPHLAGIDHVLLSPDRFLWQLPFGAIELEGGRYLIEEATITDVSAASSLIRSASSTTSDERAGDGDLLVMGGVAFDERTDALHVETGTGSSTHAVPAVDRARSEKGSFRELPSTKEEIRKILETWHAAGRNASAVSKSPPTEMSRDCCLEGSGATEDALKRSLPGKRFVHLATHGFFEPRGLQSWWQELDADRDTTQLPAEFHRVVGLMPGLMSGLVCAGANLAPVLDCEDGYLTAEEIAWRDLSKCELVVLSACDTGLGTERGGEGLASVQRAFELAGARSVIASLWEVNDASAAELMKSFYENFWLNGEGKAESLRHAQLEMLKKNRREHEGDARPWTWGAFVLNGDWR